MVRTQVAFLAFLFLSFALPQAHAEDITRFQAIDSLWTSFTMPTQANTDQSVPLHFTDVPYSHDHFSKLAYLCSYQILDCTAQTLFRGDDAITYPAFFKIAFGMAKVRFNTNTFAMSPTKESWHVPYMNKALERGLISDTLRVGAINTEDFSKVMHKLSVLTTYHFTVPTYFKGLEKTPEAVGENLFETIKEVDDSLSIYHELYHDLVSEWSMSTTPMIQKVLLVSSMVRLTRVIPAIQEISDTMHSHPLLYDQSYSAELRDIFRKHNIKELIGEGVYDFSNNAEYRKWNIRHSIKNIDNLVLQPGEEFNYWDIMYKGGLDQVKNGWLIVGNKEVWGWGGGLCGTSTAIFRGAWMSGLEITERRPHSIYYSDMYAMSDIGLDAAVYQDSPNLRFKNNTETPILIHTAYNTNRDIVRVQILGTKHFEHLSFSGPERKGGRYIQSRTFEYANGSTNKEELYSTYREIQ